MGKRVSFITMGCAKNEADSERMARDLEASGYEIVDDPLQADAVIVNTCSFIQAATEESIDAILEAAGYDNVESGDAKLVVAGCMPSRYEAELSAEFPEVSRFIPCAEEDKVAQVMGELLGGAADAMPLGGDGACVPGLQVDSERVPASQAASAYVKISDGCDRFCSYCTIPFIRGRYRSFTYEEIEREVARHIGRGVREIVLIAQDTGRWGNDFEEPSTLARLVAQLAEGHSDTWFRIMYIQPEGITDELINVVASHDNVCSYFDIPFQHCDEELLRAMNRSGSREQFMGLIERIRARVPGVALRTTLIAGYPGETDEQLDDLCSFVEEAELDYVGVFPYSREEGTRAYGLPDQHDEGEKLARAQRVRDVADAVSGAVIAERVGQEMGVLVCGSEEDGQLFGRAQCQAPDVDGVTYIAQGNVGDIVDVVIADTLLYEMEGEACA